MTYRELLNYCIQNPGCIQTRSQKMADSKMMYSLWRNTEDAKYYKKPKDNFWEK